VEEGRLLFRWFAIKGNPIDGVPTAEWRIDRKVSITGMEVVLFQEFVDVSFLREVDGETTITGVAPFIVHSKVVAQNAHKVNLKAGSKGLFKPFLCCIIRAKVEAIIHVGAKVNGAPRGGGSNEDAWVMRARSETNVSKYFLEGLVPVAWASMQAIKGLDEVPISARFGVGTPTWWRDNTDLILRKIGMAKGVLSVTLLDHATF
jgi:hypothetical protein